MTTAPSRKWIFLSHSGLDHQRATELAKALERALSDRGHHVDVFNTSEPEHRFRELREMLAAGDNWATRAKEYDQELRAYLDEHLRQSAAFLALVTPRSLRAASKVIEYEIDVARSIATENRRLFFFPCVADGAALRDLPRGAEEFQGIVLEGENGMVQLSAALDRALSRDA